MFQPIYRRADTLVNLGIIRICLVQFWMKRCWLRFMLCVSFYTVGWVIEQHTAHVMNWWHLDKEGCPPEYQGQHATQVYLSLRGR